MCRRSIISGGDEIFLNPTDGQDISYIKHQNLEGNIVKPKIKERCKTEIIEEELKSISARLDMYNSRIKRLEEYIYGKDAAGLIRVISNVETIKDKMEKEESNEEETDELPFFEFRSKEVHNRIQKQLEKEEKELLKPVVSYTTRPIRSSEVNGREHIFISESDFIKNFNKNDFAAYTEINGYKYFTTISQLEKCNAYIIDPIGVEYLLFNERFRSKNFKVFVIYVYTDSVTRYKRYISRDSKNIEEISLEYIKRDSSENYQFTLFEHVLGNLTFDTYEELKKKKEISSNFWAVCKIMKGQLSTEYMRIPGIDNGTGEVFRAIAYNNTDYINPGLFPLANLINKTIAKCKEEYKTPLFCFVGRTSSGKDTICRKIMDYVNN